MNHASVAARSVTQTRGLDFVIAIAIVALVTWVYVSPLGVALFAAAVVFLLAALGFRPLLWTIIFFLPLAPYLNWNFPIKDLATLVRFSFFAGTVLHTIRQGVDLRGWLMRGKLTWAILVYFVVAVFSAVVFNPGTGGAARELMRLASYVCFYYSITAWVESEADFREVFRTVILSTVCVALFGFYQFLAGGYTAVYEALYPFQDDAQKAPEWSGRITSFLGHFNSFAGYLNLVIPFFVVLALRAEDQRLRAYARICFVLSSAALVLTQSRGALLAYTVILLMAAWFLAPTRAARLRWLGSAVAIAVPSALLLGTIFQRLSGIDEYTEITRLAVWAGAGAVFSGSPIVGIGFGNLRTVLAGFINLPDDFILDAHNLYLELLAETGIIGMIVFLILIFIALRIGWRLLRERRDPVGNIVGLASVAAIAGVLVHGTVDYMFHTSPQFSAMFFLVLALLNAADRHRSAIDAGLLINEGLAS